MCILYTERSNTSIIQQYTSVTDTLAFETKFWSRVQVVCVLNCTVYSDNMSTHVHLESTVLRTDTYMCNSDTNCIVISLAAVSRKAENTIQ